MKAKKAYKRIRHVPFLICFLLIAILLKVNISTYESTDDKNTLSSITAPDLYGKTTDEVHSILDSYGLPFLSSITVPDLYGKTVGETHSTLDIYGLTFITE